MNVERGLPTEIAFASEQEIKSVVRLTFYEMQVRSFSPFKGFVILIWRILDMVWGRCPCVFFPHLPAYKVSWSGWTGLEVVSCLWTQTEVRRPSNYYLYRTCWSVIIVRQSTNIPRLTMFSVCSSGFIHSVILLDLTVPATIARINHWTTAAFCLTLSWVFRLVSLTLHPIHKLLLSENFYCASIIAFHIWRSQSNLKVRQSLNRDPNHQLTSFQPVLRIFVESVGLWT